MKSSNRAQWNRVRSAGLRRFILINGALRFGGSTAALLVALIWSLSKFQVLGTEPAEPTFWPRVVLLALAEVAIVGPLWAIGTWYLSERLYRGGSQSGADHAA